ncbi:MAG: hypothetical protein VX589_02290 [Myxococcota bacterium]|nr:hypothetical protein [Myxococcota bacterium]
MTSIVKKASGFLHGFRLGVECFFEIRALFMEFIEQIAALYANPNDSSTEIFDKN